MRTYIAPDDIIDDCAHLLARVATGEDDGDALSWAAMRLCAPGLVDLAPDIISVAGERARALVIDFAFGDARQRAVAAGRVRFAQSDLRDQLSGMLP